MSVLDGQGRWWSTKALPPKQVGAMPVEIEFGGERVVFDADAADKLALELNNAAERARERHREYVTEKIKHATSVAQRLGIVPDASRGVGPAVGEGR